MALKDIGSIHDLNAYSLTAPLARYEQENGYATGQAQALGGQPRLQREDMQRAMPTSVLDSVYAEQFIDTRWRAYQEGYDSVKLFEFGPFFSEKDAQKGGPSVYKSGSGLRDKWHFVELRKEKRPDPYKPGKTQTVWFKAMSIVPERSFSAPYGGKQTKRNPEMIDIHNVNFSQLSPSQQEAAYECFVSGFTAGDVSFAKFQATAEEMEWDAVTGEPVEVEEEDIEVVENPSDSVYVDLAYGNEYKKIKGKWHAKFSHRSPSYKGDTWQNIDGEHATIARMIASGKIVKKNPSLKSRASELLADVKHAFTKRKRSRQAIARLKEAETPAPGVRPGKFGLGKNPKQRPGWMGQKATLTAKKEIWLFGSGNDQTHSIIRPGDKVVVHYNKGLDSASVYEQKFGRMLSSVIPGEKLKETFKSVPASWGEIGYRANPVIRATDHPDTSPSYHARGTSTEVRSPTSTSTEVRSPTETSTSTSTDAYTAGNLTVTGGAGSGAYTNVRVYQHKMPESNRGSERAQRRPWDGVPQVHRTENGRRQRNPESTARELYKTFNGRESQEIVEVHTDVHEHETLTALGLLCSLRVKTPFGKSLINIAPVKSPRQIPDPRTLSREDQVLLCSNEDGTSMYFVGGDQSVDTAALGFTKDEYIKDLMVLGILEQVTYQAKKPHLGDDDDTAYYHALAEEGGTKPSLLYDPISCLLSLAGGTYYITAEGIRD